MTKYIFCRMVRIGLLYLFLLPMCVALAQNRPFLKEDFEKDVFVDSLNKSLPLRRYGISTYLPKDKGPINIYSNKKDYPFNVFYYENSCPIDSSNILKGFYAGITVYDKVTPSDRILMVIKLDALMEAGKNYTISYDSKYHQFTKYRIDSMQVLFVASENDIKLWLASREFSGMYVNLSLDNIDNKIWKSVRESFTATAAYNYMVIGNLQPDEQTRAYKADDCRCEKHPKGFWDYSEIFLDNITIIEK